MVDALRRRFGSIRWKLTGSYVLVALLIALFGDLLLVITLIVLLNSRIIPNAMAQRANRLAGDLAPEFAAAQSRDQQVARFRLLMEAELRASEEVVGPGAPPTQPQVNFGGT